MQLTYKFRMYPTKENEQKLLWTLDKCRLVYNYLLEQKSKNNLKRGELQALLPELKQEHPELQGVHSKVLQYENYRLQSNIIALHQQKKKGRKIGKLRFKGQNWFKTFSYNQTGFRITEHQTRHDTFHLSKIGDIPFVMHRKTEGKIKQITIKHQPSGKWFASVICEQTDEIPKTTNTNKVGIDLGLDNFVYDSDGNHFDHPKCFRKSEKKLAREQRKLSRKKKKSNNRAKQKVKVARVHEKVASQRDDFLHKLSRHYVANYGFIAHEDLNVSGMTRNRYLAKSITDASWSRFMQMLHYKAERAGGEVAQTPRFYPSSKTCSKCGAIQDMSLSKRTYECKACGNIEDRDYNSAKNILRVGQGLPEFTPVETGPLSARASPVVEAGSPHPSGVGNSLRGMICIPNFVSSVRRRLWHALGQGLSLAINLSLSLRNYWRLFMWKNLESGR